MDFYYAYLEPYTEHIRVYNVGFFKDEDIAIKSVKNKSTVIKNKMLKNNPYVRMIVEHLILRDDGRYVVEDFSLYEEVA